MLIKISPAGRNDSKIDYINNNILSSYEIRYIKIKGLTMKSTSPRFLIFFICFVTLSFPANASLINGNFSNNVNNWTISNFGSGDPADFYSIENNGSDPYLKVNSRLFANGLKALSFTQDIAVSSANALFSADIKVFSPTLDVSGSGANQFQGDAVLFTAQSSSLGQQGLGLIYESNRFFGSTLGNSLDTISSQPGFFDLHLQADLSAFIGQTTSI